MTDDINPTLTYFLTSRHLSHIQKLEIALALDLDHNLSGHLLSHIPPPLKLPLPIQAVGGAAVSSFAPTPLYIQINGVSYDDYNRSSTVFKNQVEAIN